MPLLIGAPIFPDIDQIDLTGPFEVLTNLPDTTFHLYAKTNQPVRDWHGLTLTPNATFADAPPLDVLVIPGGPGTLPLMEDETTLDFLRTKAKSARFILSVCTGATLLGAAGLLNGRRATTHWNSHHLLHLFGATPINERVVVDNNLVTCAGITAGIDGALKLAALLSDNATAQYIQLILHYAPEPPFNSGTPESAPKEILTRAKQKYAPITAAREKLARNYQSKMNNEQ